ncbi:MAG: thioredoxin family protein [Candidatus Bathyarchaeia archaeon]
MVLVEVIGVVPPCHRCAATEKNVKEAASKLKNEGIEVTIKHLDVSSKDVISKYGLVLTPALAVDGKVRVAGRIPNPDEILKIIKESIEE